MRIRSLLLLPALALPIACDRASEQVPAYEPPAASEFAFDSATVRIETAADTQRVRVEVAERDDQRARGLMERPSLAEDAGMIFLYDAPQPGDAGFWMYRTLIPLDIAFFDNDGRIIAIRQMEPCPSYDRDICAAAARAYKPDAAYLGALEMNRGWFARHNIKPGDRIVLERS